MKEVFRLCFGISVKNRLDKFGHNGDLGELIGLGTKIGPQERHYRDIILYQSSFKHLMELREGDLPAGEKRRYRERDLMFK